VSASKDIDVAALIADGGLLQRQRVRYRVLHHVRGSSRHTVSHRGAGVEVTVTGVDLTEDEQIVAICARGRSRQRIPILDLPLPTPPPQGAEWIAAYRHWWK
jgi:hypothetical protein